MKLRNTEFFLLTEVEINILSSAEVDFSETLPSKSSIHAHRTYASFVCEHSPRKL